jgi:hypothetical protein
MMVDELLLASIFLLVHTPAFNFDLNVAAKDWELLDWYQGVSSSECRNPCV